MTTSNEKTVTVTSNGGRPVLSKSTINGLNEGDVIEVINSSEKAIVLTGSGARSETVASREKTSITFPENVDDVIYDITLDGEDAKVTLTLTTQQ